MEDTKGHPASERYIWKMQRDILLQSVKRTEPLLSIDATVDIFFFICVMCNVRCEMIICLYPIRTPTPTYLSCESISIRLIALYSCGKLVLDRSFFFFFFFFFAPASISVHLLVTRICSIAWVILCFRNSESS